MILPFLDGFMPFRKIPITWILLIFNMFIFSQNWGLSQLCNDQFMSWYQDEEFIYTQGQIYLQHQEEGSDVKKIKDIKAIGKMAFKDEAFLKLALTKKWQGDEVAIAQWRKDLEQYMVLREIYPAFFYGVSGVNNSFFSFVSYQFFHESFWHLLGNILLIMIIGGYLERRFSGMVVFLTYISTGFLSAYIYSLTAQLSGAPLIGASGSLCGLFGFLFYAQFEEKTRLFYLILPIKKYMGFVNVKTCYWVIWFCMIEDLAGLIARPELFVGGIAHIIHLLGFIFGIAFAYVYVKSGRRITPTLNSAIS